MGNIKIHLIKYAFLKKKNCDNLLLNEDIFEDNPK
jgi:hypothetical protein